MTISLMNCSPFLEVCAWEWEGLGNESLLGSESLGMGLGAWGDGWSSTPMILRMLELRSWRAVETSDGEH